MQEKTGAPAPQARARRTLVALLRAGAACRGEEAPLIDLGDAAKPVDDELVRLMMRHRVAAYLHPLLDAQPDPDVLPVELSALCRQVYYAVLRHNAVGLEVGEALLDHMARDGIDAVPRGPWAVLRGANPVHEDPGRRPLDGLVVSLPPEGQARARDLARGLGFEEPRGQAGIDARLWRRIGRLRLPLEFRVAPPPDPLVRGLFDAVQALAEARFGRWIGLLDVHHLMGAGLPPLGGPELRARFAREGAERDLVRALRLTRELLGTRLPADSVPPARGLRTKAQPRVRESSTYIGVNP